MSIVSSTIHEQLDLGAMWQVRERHTDSEDVVHEWLYHPAKSVDLNARLAEHAIQLAENLAAAEAEALLNG
jgi:phosphoenolpyruvate-protein kinase (PTS system EI component)